MKKIHKVTHIVIFDFKTSPYAYAIASNKNQYGYLYKHRYYLGEKVIYDGQWNDNVEASNFYWLAFHMNQDQLKSLERRINKIKPDDKLEIIDFPSQIALRFASQSTIVYQGEHKEEFVEKVLAKRY